jgi:hypothetical protein
MQTNLNTFLKELANDEELHGNKTSWTIAKYFSKINTDNRESFYESLLPFYPKEKNDLDSLEITLDNELKVINSFYGKDYRIKTLQLSNVRGIPENKDGKLFGVDLTIGGCPKSNIILGSNGVGKSSIYTALEYIFCGRIGEAQLRTFKDELKEEDDYFKNYLTRFDNKFREINCSIQTMEGDFHLHGDKIFPKEVKRKINPETHFVSDYDIYNLGRYEYEGASNKSFHNLIAISLGLTDFLNFNRLINEFVYWDRRKEKLAISKFSKERLSNENDIKTWNEEVKKRKGKLLELKMDTKASINTEYIGALELVEKVKSNLLTLNFDSQIFIDTINEYRNNYLEFSSFDISALEQKKFEFLVMGLDLLEKSDNCPFCENSKSDKVEIKNEVHNRIDKIQQYNKIRQKTILSYDNLIAKTNELTINLVRVMDSLKRENEEIKTFPDLVNIHSSNKEIIQKFSIFLETNLIKQILNHPNFTLDNSRSILGLLDKSDKDFISALKEILVSFNAYEKSRKQEIEKTSKAIKDKTGNKSVVEQKAILNKEILDFESKIKSISTRNESINEELIDLTERFDLLNEIKREAQEYSKILNKKINEIVDLSYEPIKIVVEEILSNYLLRDEVSLEIGKDDVVDLETGEVTSQIIVARLYHRSNPSIKITPNKYFNTFRYRLFSMMVGISVAIASRKNTGINMPLVLDDVFYASDFEKRTTIINFINNLFKIFKEYSNQELQLILFTHDELIFDSVISAFIEMGIEDDVVFSKLLPYKDAEPNDDFLELTYRIPNSKPVMSY